MSIRRPSSPFRTGAFVVMALTAAFAAGTVGARELYPRVEKLTSGRTNIVGEPITYPSGTPANVTGVIVSLKPGEVTGWHKHPVPLFGYVLEGELTVDYGAHGTRVYRKGDSLLEAMTVVHNGTNTGSGIMRVLAVFIGGDGIPNAVPVDPKAPADVISALKKTLQARLAVMVDVARYKWNNDIAIENAEREAVVLAKTVERATSEGVSPDLARAVVSAQIEAAKMIQRSLFARWRREKAGKFADALDLKADLRPKILALTGDLIANLKAATGQLGRCASHTRLAVSDEALSAFPNAWRAAVAGVLAEHPVCEDQ